jgi:TM2 domain-containing membrane protein YozV
MRGQVLGVDTRTGDGLVSGDDGRRYRFRPEDWADRGEPAVGLHVDFETSGERALSLLPVPGSTPAPRAYASSQPTSDRNRVVAALLAFFVGTLGLHRFYLGRTGSGIAMLILSCTIVGLLVTGPWALVDTIRFLLMGEREFAHRYARLR